MKQEPLSAEDMAVLNEYLSKIAIFDYPIGFTTLPEYSAHRGQNVTVVRELGPEENENEERMFEIRANDGWTGHAYESELCFPGNEATP